MHPCRCRGLCGAAVTFLANDHMELSAIGFAGRLLRVPGGLGVDLGAHDLAAPDDLSPLGAHGWALQRHPRKFAIHDTLAPIARDAPDWSSRLVGNILNF